MPWPQAPLRLVWTLAALASVVGMATVAIAAGTRAGPRAKDPTPAATAKLGTRPAGLGLAPGDHLPDVSAADLKGREVKLRALNDRGALLFVFYRGGWCPFCNAQLRSLSRAAARFTALGVTPVAVSVDAPDKASLTRASWEIPFPVLSDPDLKVHEAFSVVHRASEEEVARLKGFGMDIEASSGRTHHAYAVPGLFLVGRDGHVLWSHVDTDYKVRPTTEQVMAVIAPVLEKAGGAVCTAEKCPTKRP